MGISIPFVVAEIVAVASTPIVVGGITIATIGQIALFTSRVGLQVKL